ncbi:hypothetical protein [Azospirillum sp. sgz302134]
MIKMLRGASYLPKGAPIYVFGAGKAGQVLVKELRKDRSVQLQGVLDNFKTGEIEGVPIQKASEFLKDPAGASVIIGSMYVDEIAKQLADAGCQDIYNGYHLALALIDRDALRRMAAMAGGVLALLVGVLWLLLA